MQPTTNFDRSSDTFTYREKHTHHRDIIERLILIIESVIIGSLTIRFFLALLGANPSNGFAKFINSSTNPFVSPFYNLFNYDHPKIGQAVFEGYTLVAMLIYTFLFSGLVKIAQITRYE